MKKGRRRGAGMRERCDFSGGVRGRYAKRYAEGTNVVVLDPDVADVFRDHDSVNETLRAVARIIDLQSGKRSGATSKSRSRTGSGTSPAGGFA